MMVRISVLILSSYTYPKYIGVGLLLVLSIEVFQNLL